MIVSVYPSAEEANAAAADCLAHWLSAPGVRAVMPAAGNTPLALYRMIGQRGLKLDHLEVFALDEYVGVPLDEPRNCANLLRRTLAEPWGIPPGQFHTVSPTEAGAAASIVEHEQKIAAGGGLDVVILGLGQNGHLGFNEPGSAEDSTGRVTGLEPVSIEANRQWFQGKHAPAKGVTCGLKTILAARQILIMAYGRHKAAAVRAMLRGPRQASCPASFLQNHPDTHVFLDTDAAASLHA